MPEPGFKYELFFELSPDLLCIAGYDGYFKKVNPAVPKALGYTMEELFARPINEFVHPEDQDITNRLRYELTQSKPLYNFENRYVTKSGEIIWLSWTSLPVPEDQLIFAIAKDVTHKKKLEAERNEMLAELSEVNQDLKQLTYTTSHDLRSPVNNLLSLLRLIEAEKVNDAETQKMLNYLKLAGERLKQTMDHYVDALSGRHEGSLVTEETDLEECLQNVLRSIDSLILTSGATITADFSRLPTLRFNKAYLESVFLNLVTNSIKYARPGLPPVINIYSESANGIDRLVVADNGQGFDLEKVQGKLFGIRQKFHGHADSKGIGLYLVHSHVTRFGGQISVESRVNEGAKFVISFRNPSADPQS